MYVFLFLIAFLVAEVAVIARVGSAIGGLAAFGLLALGVFAGGWLISRQSAKTQNSFLFGAEPGGSAGGSPFDALFSLLAGLLFVFPGFISDFLALLLLIPPVRLLLLAGVGSFLMSRLLPRMQGGRFGRFNMPGFGGFGAGGGFRSGTGTDGFGGSAGPDCANGFDSGSASGFGNQENDPSDEIIIEGEFRDVTEELRARQAAERNGGQEALEGKDGRGL